jgi:hypothetical protein
MQISKASLYGQGIYVEKLTPARKLAALARALWPVQTRFELQRYGSANDGGYLLPADLDGIAACFSPGVSDNASFESDLLQRTGIPSHLADFSVEGPPAGFVPRTFTKKYIGATDDNTYMTMDRWVRATDDFRSGRDLLLLATSDEVLSRFRVIALEVHHGEAWGSQAFYRIAEALFAKLLRHFVVVHNHVNNYGGVVDVGGFVVPDVFELTLLRRDRAKALGYCRSFPHPLDAPNNKRRKETPLPRGWHGPGQEQG